MTKIHCWLPRLLGIALATFSLSGWAAAGKVQFVFGDVQIINNNGAKHAAHKGDAVNEGDTLLTAPGASAQLLMSDKGLIALRPDSRLKIETYRFTGAEDGSEKGILGLLKGGFRAITGLIGRTHKSNYLIKTPNATIGIRGTDHEPMYIPPPAPGETPIGEPGTYNKVNSGETFIENAQGRIELSANQAGFSPPNSPPVRLEKIPAFFRATPPVHQSRKEAKQDEDTASSGTTDTTESTGESTSTTSSTASATDETRSSSLDEQPLSGTGTTVDTTTTDTVAATTVTQTTTTVAPLTSTGGTCLTCATTTSTGTPAPAGTVVAGAYRTTNSGSVILSAGATDASKATILRDANKLPTLIAENGSTFSYDRSGAPDIPASAGATTVGTGTNATWVNWGIYAGGQKTDSMSGGVAEPVTHFAWMVAEGGATPTTWLQNNLASFPSGLSFNVVGGFTLPIDETGGVGGSVNSILAKIQVSGGIPSLVQYDLKLVDAQSRYWTATLQSPISLTTFNGGASGSGTSTNLSVDRRSGSYTGPIQGTGSGKVSGYVIGPQSPTGVVSSYELKDSTSAGVTGTVLAK